MSDMLSLPSPLSPPAPPSLAAVYARIKSQLSRELWRPEAEEFEDSLGNVLDKKTYEDLARQGLL